MRELLIKLILNLLGLSVFALIGVLLALGI